MKLAKDRPIKPESLVLESLIADFAREIQVLAAPAPEEDRRKDGSVTEASPEERRLEGSGGQEEQKQAPEISLTPKPVVTQPTAAVPLQERRPSSATQKDQKRAAASVTTKPAVTQPTKALPAREALPAQEGQGSSSAASKEKSRQPNKSPIRLRKGQDGSWVIVIGKATGGAAWRRTRIRLFTALAITAALLLGWLAGTGFGLA